jgi:hypothetical protein
MWKLVIPALAAALTGCGGGGGSAESAATAAQAAIAAPTLISGYQNEISSGQVFNSAVADLNGDGLDDIVVSGWAVAPSNWVGSRSGFVNLKIFIQQDNGSLVDQTNDLIGAANSLIWGSQRILIDDFDRNGKLDIAVMGFQDGPAAVPAPSVVFWNNGSAFSRAELPEQVVAHAACAGDLNGDGLPELVTGSNNSHVNTIYANQGQKQLVFDRTLTQEGISSGGACAVLKDPATGNVAIVTTNIPWYPFFSAVTKVWDRYFNFVADSPLPGSEESGTNLEILHDIVNLVPVDINRDGHVDLITTDNGNWRLSHANGYMSVLINQGNFNFKNETDRYLPNQTKTSFFNYYYHKLTVDGYPAVFLDHGSLGVSLWQIKNNTMVKYKEQLLNSLVRGYSYTNIYRTKNGLSLFLVDGSEYSRAKFYYRPIQLN